MLLPKGTSASRWVISVCCVQRGFRALGGTKPRLVLSGVWPQCLHGAETCQVPLSVLKRLRTQAGRAVSLAKPGVSPWLACSVGAHQTVDPAYCLLIQRIRLFRLMWRDFPQGRARMRRGLISLRGGTGGVSYLLAKQLRGFGWLTVGLEARDDHGRVINLVETPLKAVRRVLESSWMDQVAANLCHRKACEAIEHIDPELSRVWIKFPLAEQSLLLTQVTGVTYTRDCLSHAVGLEVSRACPVWDGWLSAASGQVLWGGPAPEKAFFVFLERPVLAGPHLGLWSVGWALWVEVLAGFHVRDRMATRPCVYGWRSAVCLFWWKLSVPQKSQVECCRWCGYPRASHRALMRLSGLGLFQVWNSPVSGQSCWPSPLRWLPLPVSRSFVTTRRWLRSLPGSSSCRSSNGKVACPQSIGICGSFSAAVLQSVLGVPPLYVGWRRISALRLCKGRSASWRSSTVTLMLRRRRSLLPGLGWQAIGVCLLRCRNVRNLLWNWPTCRSPLLRPLWKWIRPLFCLLTRLGSLCAGVVVLVLRLLRRARKSMSSLGTPLCGGLGRSDGMALVRLAGPTPLLLSCCGSLSLTRGSCHLSGSRVSGTCWMSRSWIPSWCPGCPGCSVSGFRPSVVSLGLAW